jgi:hypothetical protein
VLAVIAVVSCVVVVVSALQAIREAINNIKTPERSCVLINFISFAKTSIIL